MLKQTIERSRTLVLGSTLLAAFGVAVPASIQAQGLGISAGANFSLDGSDATEQALRSGEGASWDVIRKGGLVLTARGEMNLADDGSSGDRAELVMFALAIDNGRVVDHWSARSSIPARTGETELAGGRFLPDDRFLPANTFFAGDQFVPEDRSIAAGDAMQAVDAGRASVFFSPDELMSASGVLLVAIPACAASTRTCAQAQVSPYFITVVDGYRR